MNHTMAKTKSISARIDPLLKRGAEEVFDELGLTASQAITLFYKQVQLRQGLPFRVMLPNSETKAALVEVREREKLPSFETAEALFEDLDI